MIEPRRATIALSIRPAMPCFTIVAARSTCRFERINSMQAMVNSPLSSGVRSG